MMMRTTVLLLLSLVVTVWGDCPAFECLNNSTCTDCSGPDKIGDVEVCRNGKRCQCPPGKSGFRCGRDFKSCYGGDHPCYNGGTCIEGIKDVYQNDQYVCDCNSAKDENGTRYVGKHCEMQAIDICDEDADMFCVNGNFCRHVLKPDDFCRCLGDTTGPHCEFKKNEVPKCDLKCKNGGKCELGIKNYPLAVLGTNDYWKNHEEAMHCRCPEGFFGLNCEVASKKCGDHHCFNGAKCVTTEGDNGKVHNCDCNAAHTNTTSYAGKYCQYEATSFCEKDAKIEGQDFCVNGGTCKSGAPDCSCPSGFGGPICEYNLSSDGGVTCDLTCQNDGICKKGVKDYSFLDAIGHGQGEQKFNAEFEHCICGHGFFGLKCEKKVELCGDGSHVCLNGAECLTIDAGKSFSCQCDQADTANARFAGPYCQHEASVYCTADAKPGVGADNLAFCVNGGKCKGTAKGKGHPGCSCKGGFKGAHCEELITSSSSSTKTNAGLVVSLTVLCVVLAVLSVVIYIRVTRRKKAAFDNQMAMMDEAMAKPVETNSTVHSNEENNGNANGPVLDMGPEKDMEGNELSNVEII